MTARYLIGDVLEVLPTLEESSVDLILTSPPFLALRSYLPADHPDKAKEGGSQSTPGEFIDWLIDVVEALDRVLAPHGSMCIELGDTYSGAGGENNLYTSGFSGSQYLDPAKVKQYPGQGIARSSNGWPADKSLSLIPELFRFSLVYGFNPLTQRTTKPWRLRNIIRWVRPNPPVGALGDKFRPATSELMVFCRTDEAGRRRYFDLDAVREPHRHDYSRVDPSKLGLTEFNRRLGVPAARTIVADPNGAPPLDWWEIPPGGYSGAHYAVFPEALCVKPIKAMCPEKVCRTCGEPSRRMVEVAGLRGKDILAIRGGNDRALGLHGPRPTMPDITRTTLGFTDCGHDNYRPGLVLDPYAGSGTTLAVAVGHGRDAIGIDLDERNARLAEERIGFFLEVVA